MNKSFQFEVAFMQWDARFLNPFNAVQGVLERGRKMGYMYGVSWTVKE